jgi:hypothetical protein
MPLKGDTGLKIPRQYLRSVAKKMPDAVGKAVRDTLFDVRFALYEEMEDVFDRPTPFIVPKNKKKPGRRGSLFVEYSIKDQNGRVYAKDLKGVVGSSLTAEEILLPHITGQDREHKRFEKALYRIGALPKGWYAVPSEEARLDKYGNLTRGSITQMLSYLQANPDAMQNTTAKSMAKKKTKYSYFVVRDRSGKPYGIKKRTSKNVAKWFVIFVSGSDYEAERLDFDFVGELAIRRQWPKNFAYWRKQIMNPKLRKVAA